MGNRRFLTDKNSKQNLIFISYIGFLFLSIFILYYAVNQTKQKDINFNTGQFDAGTYETNLQECDFSKMNDAVFCVESVGKTLSEERKEIKIVVSRNNIRYYIIFTKNPNIISSKTWQELETIIVKDKIHFELADNKMQVNILFN